MPCRYPQARIISVEASSRNFRSLLQNARPYPNIIPINVALWPRVAALSLTLDSWNLKQRHDWGYVVRETREVGAWEGLQVTTCLGDEDVGCQGSIIM